MTASDADFQTTLCLRERFTKGSAFINGPINGFGPPNQPVTQKTSNRGFLQLAVNPTLRDTVAGVLRVVRLTAGLPIGEELNGGMQAMRDAYAALDQRGARLLEMNCDVIGD